MGKSLEELRVERYVSCIMSIDRILSDREAKRLSNPEALTNADYYMAQIMDIGAVDGENARTLLQEKGIDDLRRMDLERGYQDLKKVCGQMVPQYGKRKTKTACC